MREVPRRRVEPPAVLRIKPLRLLSSALLRGAKDRVTRNLSRPALIIAPPQDDETLGCGGTIIKKRRTIHVWLTWHDKDNAELMVLLAYILLGHHDWRRAEIRVYAALPSDQVASQRRGFRELIAEGRLPIPERNIRFLASDSGESFDDLVAHESAEADLVVFGMTEARLTERGAELLARHPSLPHLLFVLARERISIQ